MSQIFTPSLNPGNSKQITMENPLKSHVRLSQEHIIFEDHIPQNITENEENIESSNFYDNTGSPLVTEDVPIRKLSQNSDQLVSKKSESGGNASDNGAIDPNILSEDEPVPVNEEYQNSD